MSDARFWYRFLRLFAVPNPFWWAVPSPGLAYLAIFRKPPLKRVPGRFLTRPSHSLEKPLDVEFECLAQTISRATIAGMWFIAPCFAVLASECRNRPRIPRLKMRFVL